MCSNGTSTSIPIKTRVRQIGLKGEIELWLFAKLVVSFYQFAVYGGSGLTTEREQKGRAQRARNSMQKHRFVRGRRGEASGERERSSPAQLPGEKTALLLTQDSLCLTLLLLSLFLPR